MQVLKKHVDMAREDMCTTWTNYIHLLLNMVVLGGPKILFPTLAVLWFQEAQQLMWADKKS